MSDPAVPATPPSSREPVLNAPLLALLLAASMPLLYLVQVQLPDMGARWALRPIDLQRGQWTGLLTVMLLHGGWAHVATNALGALTFGAPAARLMRGWGGAVAFLLFYIACGVAAGLGYALVHAGGTERLVGASGAVFGLIGASTRLLTGRLAPLFDRRVLTMSAAWMAVNLLTGLIGLAPGMSGARIAWEAHAFGFLAGILLIGPVVRLLPRPAPTESSGFADPDAEPRPPRVAPRGPWDDAAP